MRFKAHSPVLPSAEAMDVRTFMSTMLDPDAHGSFVRAVRVTSCPSLRLLT